MAINIRAGENRKKMGRWSREKQEWLREKQEWLREEQEWPREEQEWPREKMGLWRFFHKGHPTYEDCSYYMWKLHFLYKTAIPIYIYRATGKASEAELMARWGQLRLGE